MAEEFAESVREMRPLVEYLTDPDQVLRLCDEPACPCDGTRRLICGELEPTTRAECGLERGHPGDHRSFEYDRDRLEHFDGTRDG